MPNNISKYLLVIFAVLASTCHSRSQPPYSYRSIPAKYLPGKLPATILVELDLAKKQAFDVTNMLPSDFVKDGSVDYTTSIQAALNAHSIVMMPDFPVMVNDSGLTINNGQVLIFNSHSSLYLKPSALPAYEILRIHKVHNVTVYNPVIYGDKEQHLGNSGQWGMGIAIRASENVRIIGPKISKCWGDGLYVGQMAKQPSRNIYIINATIDNNRRNGISITSAKNVLINDGVVANAKGQMPMSGIDVEPNFQDDVIDSISISNVITWNNPKYGIVISLQKLAGRKQGQTAININHHTDEYSGHGMAVIGKPGNAVLTGKIEVANSQWLNNTEGPLRLPVRSYGTKVKFKNVKTVDNDKVRLLLKSQPDIDFD